MLVSFTMSWQKVSLDVQIILLEINNIFADQLLHFILEFHASIPAMSHYPLWYSHVTFGLYHVGYGADKGSIDRGVTNKFWIKNG